MDFARSASPAVQEQLDRLIALSPGRDILGLERISALLARLGNPERCLPPVFHVAGTNGKGSTCAFLRAALEAAGHRVHVYSSPHLVRFNERIRLSGALIEDEALGPLLAEVLDNAYGIGPSFFEVTTAAAFLAFARTPADACVIEVGLGGRLDATNVIPAPAVCGIAQLGIDHQAFLGHDAVTIGREKAGIAKNGVPLVTLDYPDALSDAVFEVAEAAGAPVFPAFSRWHYGVANGRFHYRDSKALMTSLPALAGAHQHANLGLAIAMLRHQDRVEVPLAALKAAPLDAHWPARLQRLGPGPLTALLPSCATVWLDGGHNPAAGAAIADHFREALDGDTLHIILGMLANKEPAGLLAPFKGVVASLTGVPVSDHAHHAPRDLAHAASTIGVPDTATATGLQHALTLLATRSASAPRHVLILGSLYLAGEALALNGNLPV